MRNFFFASPERQRRVSVTRRWRRGLVIAIVALSLLTTSCQQEMAKQPSYHPLEPTDFYADGRASRPLVEGTVPRGRPLSQSKLLTYRKGTTPAGLRGNLKASGFAALLRFAAGSGVQDYVDVCPLDIDQKALARGRERFNIYCAVCHDALGTGNGKIVERGYLPPPNYHTDYSRGFARRGYPKVLLREAPLGYFFEVITHGYGAMPDYKSQIPPEDRWKIIAYVRVLQRSQWTPLEDLPESEREKVRRELQDVEERP